MKKFSSPAGVRVIIILPGIEPTFLKLRRIMASVHRKREETPNLCREDFKGEQKRASKGGQIHWARIWRRRAGRCPALGSWARMLMVPLGWRQWRTRVPALTPTRRRSWPMGTRPSGPTLSGVCRLQM